MKWLGFDLIFNSLLSFWILFHFDIVELGIDDLIAYGQNDREGENYLLQVFK